MARRARSTRYRDARDARRGRSRSASSAPPAGLDDEAVALLALYDDAATVASAALKLLPLDPARRARWLAELAPEIDAAAREVAADARPVAEQPRPPRSRLELAAPVHARTRERLFAS